MENRESTRHREFRRRKLLFENREEVEDENISIVYDDELTFILFFARQRQFHRNSVAPMRSPLSVERMQNE